MPWIERVIDPASKVVAGMKPPINRDENAAVETAPISTLPKPRPTSAALTDKSGYEVIEVSNFV